MSALKSLRKMIFYDRDFIIKYIYSNDVTNGSPSIIVNFYRVHYVRDQLKMEQGYRISIFQLICSIDSLNQMSVNLNLFISGKFLNTVPMTFSTFYKT